ARKLLFCWLITSQARVNLERMDRRRPTESARSKQPSRGATSLGLLLCVFSLLYWAPGRASGSEPSETKSANQGSADNAKSKPVVYETYDPEKALANKPVPSGHRDQDSEGFGVNAYLFAGAIFLSAALGSRKLLQVLSRFDPWNATKRKVQELLPGLG